ncbi:hypothetical protein [Frigoribacterium sp. VKM Ac-2836]|uniref:hypothetical protein n=1 Tax=Frigoribacterium sp. VKM Ac-2836 TaxID=2739014 RepID=UPI001565BEA5|nr:hypothetical protein [Frigoribacterium sp. VKM Ac-2836]NRD26423.1 hypothetical protein [Frigoribacterium sp. VKM Ac-2836]
MPNPTPAMTRPSRSTTHDTAELLLVDLATARYAPGDSLDVDTIVREHRVTPGEVHLALFELRRMKVVVRAPFSGAHVVVWHRRFNEVLLGDLVRMISVASTKATSLEEVPEPAVRRPACAAHGLTLPMDVAHFLDLARAIVQVLSPAARQHVQDDLLLPLEILCSSRAVEVHDMRPALGESVRGAIVDLVEAAAHFGDWARLPGLASEYVTALGVDEPRGRPVD